MKKGSMLYDQFGRKRKVSHLYKSKKATPNFAKQQKKQFKKKEEVLTSDNLTSDKIDEEISLTEKPQQSFIFENEGKTAKTTTQSKIKYKLPSIEFLEKNS